MKLLFRNKLATINLGVLLLASCLAVFAPYVAPMDPYTISNSLLSPPNSEHLLGTDDFGRDILSRIIYGIRISLLVGTSVAVITGILGALFGLIAGFYGKSANLIMRSMDVLMSFPAILLALAIVAVFGPSTGNAILALSVVYIPRTTRVIYSSALKIKNNDYVEAAKAIGCSDARILLKHLLPNCFSMLLVQQTFIFAAALLSEAALSFLGAGTPPPIPSLGNMLSRARDYLAVAPWLMIFPGITIVIIVLAINLLGDALRDILDPRLRKLQI